MQPKLSRGEIYYAELDPVIGSEQGGIRPVLVIQNDVGNWYSSTTIVAALTSKQKCSLPIHLLLEDRLGLTPGSVVLLEQIRTIDKSRLRGYMGQLDQAIMRLVDVCLSQSLGLITNNGSSVMTLCRICANDYRDTGAFELHRINPNQQIKETCCRCSRRTGFDYQIKEL